MTNANTDKAVEWNKWTPSSWAGSDGENEVALRRAQVLVMNVALGDVSQPCSFVASFRQFWRLKLHLIRLQTESYKLKSRQQCNFLSKDWLK